jgi:ATP-dependent Lon protease
VVAFDEFAGKQKRVDKALVDIMKNYMANKSFSRGVETLGAEASMVFVGNTEHTVPYMLKHSDLFDPLPDKFHDSAFLDRIHYYIPGWEVDIIRGEMFSSGYGFVVDYLAEILRSLRSHDFHDRYQANFTLSSDISTRDRDGIHKTFSGLMKILFPHGEATPAEIEEMLKFAMEGRKRVKDQLLRIDTTYAKVAYTDMAGKQQAVSTLEEDAYPGSYNRAVASETSSEAGDAAIDLPASKLPLPPVATEAELREQHLTWQENQRGLTFDALFGPYLKGAAQITITDPYIRMFHQLRNLMELMETLARIKPEEDEVAIHLITGEDDFKGMQQKEQLQKIADACTAIGIRFTWEFDTSGTIHARHIVTDHGWKILLDRGLDVFQRYEMNDSFEFANRLQQYRQCKAFEVTFIRNVSN